MRAVCSATPFSSYPNTSQNLSVGAARPAAVEAQLMAKESERLAAVMKAEKAETSAVAAQNELLEVTKRWVTLSYPVTALACFHWHASHLAANRYRFNLHMVSANLHSTGFR